MAAKAFWRQEPARVDTVARFLHSVELNDESLGDMQDCRGGNHTITCIERAAHAISLEEVYVTSKNCAVVCLWRFVKTQADWSRKEVEDQKCHPIDG